MPSPLQPLGSPQYKELLTKQLASSTQEKGRQDRQAGAGWAGALGSWAWLFLAS